MAAIDFDDLVATMGGSCIGQEAMDLKALHAQLAQSLFLPPSNHHPSGQPTPVSSYTMNTTPAPPSSLTNQNHTNSPYAFNNNQALYSQQPSSYKSGFDAPPSSYGTGRPILDRTSFSSSPHSSSHHRQSSFSSQQAYPSPMFASPRLGGNSPLMMSGTPLHASPEDPYASFHSPQQPHHQPLFHSSFASSPSASTGSPFGVVGRQTRSQTRAAAAQQQSLWGEGGGAGGYDSSFAGAGYSGRRGSFAPPSSRSSSAIRSGGRDVDMG